jgi:tol-pal system protein YbgF
MLYGRGKLADSRKAFQQVFDADPSGELADNALYWIGETWFATGDYQNAIRFFRRVTTDYGDQNKAPDAAYKTGVALAKSGDLQLAKQAFDECIKRYPYSTSAASAKQELERIKF